MTIDMSKQYRTRDGRPVRILCVDRNHSAYPVVGLTTGKLASGEPCEIVMNWKSSGRVTGAHESGGDLIEVKPRIKRTVFLNMYQKEEEPCAHLSREAADRDAHHARIACIKVELDFEEGEGL